MDELKMDEELSLDEELGAEFADLEAEMEAVEDGTELAEDLEGFASGFPAWDLHPPYDEYKKKGIIK